MAPLLLLAVGSALAPVTDVAAAIESSSFCATQTQKCVRGTLYGYWRENNGVNRLGLPISDEFDEQGADGAAHRVQYFERARLEYHQESINTPAVIQQGLIGKEQFAAKYPQGRPASGAGEQCFAETGACLLGGFRAYWNRNGGLAQFGFPISDEFDEAGQRVQYFERARFEYRPENAGTPGEVSLALLGRDALAAKYPQGPPPAATGFGINIWENSKSGIAESVAGLPPRVYVPDELNGNVTVIDPTTFRIIDRYPTGRTTHHVAPAPDFSSLYVNNMGSSTLSNIDPQTGKVFRTIPAAVPYNLYFTTDGTKAIVAAEPNNALDFYDPQTWRLIKRLPIAGAGVDHLDMSADGTFLLVGTEFDGQVVKVDTVNMRVVGAVRVGGQPIDVKASPDGSLFYVANQSRAGVSVIDPFAMREVAFIPTGAGTHGLAISRNTENLYIANRVGGSISVLNFATNEIVSTWRIGGSPDMLQVSPDGAELWASGRFNGQVYVVDTRTGGLARAITTGAAPHGLTYFPQPGRMSLGHNGVYR